MSIRRFGLIASLAALTVIGPARPALAAQDGPMYWVCEFNTRTQPTSTLYVSDVTGPYGPRMNTGYTSDYLEREFGQFLRATYQAGGATHCSGFDSVSKAKDLIARLIKFAANAKVVETGWKSSAPAQPTGRNPADAAPVTTYGYCWIISADYTAYISRRADYGLINIQSVNSEYQAFIEKTYGFRQSATCRGARDAGELDLDRQRQIDQLKRTPRVKFVEFDWVPAAKPAAPTKAPAPAPAPPPPPQTRPAPSSAGAKPSGQPDTPAPAKPASQAAAPMYVYCYASGKPTSGSAKQHFYMSQLIQVAANERLNQDFQAFLHGAHPGENITASCSGAVPLENARKGRQTALDFRRTQTATVDVVEVDWKR